MKTETLLENPSLLTVINEIHSEPWPRFLSEDSVVKRYWRTLYEMFPRYQFVFKEDSEYLGLANVSPIAWNGSAEGLPAGFDEAVETIVKSDRPANTLCVLAIVVRNKYAGKGISSAIIEIVKERGRQNGFGNLILPVRPVLKSQYPLISMTNYMRWEKDGWPFDPWLRVHVRAGGRILKEADPSMVVRGTVAEWEDWTGMYFAESGEYIVEGALNPIKIDLEHNCGEYVEPNVWVLHQCV